MTTHATKKESLVEFEKDYHHHKLDALIKPTSSEFEKILRSYIVFNIFFFSLIALEILYLLFNLTFLAQTFVLAIHLAFLSVTIFFYFTLRLYFQTKKTERYLNLRAEFIQTCLHCLGNQNKLPEYHLAIANTCCRLAVDLHGKEYQVYHLPALFDFLSSSIEKISCWCHWKDVHFMKELLLQASIEEHIKLVKMEPTHLEFHAGLANAYVMLSGLYVDPRTVDGLDDEHWIPPYKYTEEFKRIFRLIAERAIEEFKILSDYAPHDPWVHAQLAYSYRDLQMPKEEIREYEIIFQLCPEDKEILFKLGKLYFEQGLNAKGLKIYETIKKSNYKKAESLIHFYGSYRLSC